jgi:hypothetical protein
MYFKHLPLLVLLISLAACQSELAKNELLVVADELEIKASPNANHQIVASALRGDVLTDMGEVSSFELRLSLNGQELQRPLIKVKNKKGIEGWVFAGAVKPEGDEAAWLLQKRLICYFGPSITQKISEAKNKGSIGSEAEFAEHFRNAILIRDTIFLKMHHKAQPSQPDMSWIADELLPGFIYQKTGEGTPPRLFADYRYWNQLAQKTTGNSDDVFINVCLAAFPADSIESGFPCWKFQFSETEGASHLGSGAHLKMFRLLDVAFPQAPVFAPELTRIKDALLEDIHDKNTQFWQSKPSILKELDAIIEQAPACLTAAEKEALLPRRQMLENAEAHGIRVNLRSGEQ